MPADILPDILFGPDGLVYLCNSEQPPLPQLEITYASDGALLDRGCSLCAWTGLDLWAYADDRTEPCVACGGSPAVLLPFVDADSDGWLDGLEVARARYTGGRRSLESVTLAVLHRYSRGRGSAGPRYVKNPQGRHVSWHATAHHADFERRATLHLPVDQIGWHAGARAYNACSIGIEIDAAPDGNVHAPYDAATIDCVEDLLRSWAALCPNLRFLTGHSDIIPPPGRYDPGKAFPRDELSRRLGWPWLSGESLRLALGG